VDTKKTIKKFEFFDVTADVGFRAYGQDLNNAFANAAQAMFEVIETFNLHAEVWGEKFNPATHEIRDEVKAVTFHLMEIIKEENRCSLQVIVDT